MILEELAGWIEGLSGLDLTTTVNPKNLFVRHLPDAPIRAVALIQAPGDRPDVVLHPVNAAIDNWRVSIFSRDSTGAAAEATAMTIYINLGDLNNSYLGTGSPGVRWLMARPLQPPFLLERDSAQRYLYGFNVAIKREQVA